MSNTIFITANWTTGALSQQTISRQYDNNRYAVQFIGYPEGDGTEELDLYLLVWMSTAPGQKPGEITPIQLNSDQWYISNYFTQQVQVIKFQLCVLNEAGTYEAHSPIFSGRIGDSLEHNGTSHDIDVSTLFDAYREYVEELIIGAGAMIIDPAPTQGSTNAVSSGGVYSALADVKNGLPEIRVPDETEADLYIGDSGGNVLVKLASGAIETKNFKGFQYITYKSASVTYSTLPLTLTVNHKFKKGDKVVLHVDRGAMPWDYGAYVNYYEDDRLVFSGKRIDCAWIEHVITEDTDAIIATYTGQPSTAGMTVGDVYTLEVSLLGDIPIQPSVVKVKKDGTGDYTTLRGALDAIGTQANDVLNPYRIEIYPGTYNVMDDYTDAEISAAVYDQTSFVGPKLLNGMYLVGIGAPNEVVLNGELDTTQFSSTIRGDISTLNCQGSCGFENLTVIANHLRYCVHDDFHTTIGKKPKRIVKDCIFRGYDISYNPGTTYGAGTSDSGCDYEFINCDFGENAGVHTLPTIAQKSFVHLVNCKGHGFRIGDQETSDPVDGYSIYQFDNCDFLWINHNMSDDVPHVIVRGSGNGSPIYQFPAATLYDTGDVVAMRNGGFSQTCNVGEVTEWFSNAGHGPRFRKATSVNGASGIVVYKDANDTYIQTKGYVCTNRTALTTFALGDYIGIANSLPVVVSDASDAIGRIAYIDNSGNGYIKLNFGG